MKTILIIAGVLVVLAAAVGLLGKRQGTVPMSSPSSSPSTETQSPEITNSTAPALSASPSPSVSPAATVTISETGFEPKSVTVKQGETITFTNTGSGLHYVASNPHPTHTDYPGLESKDLAPGQSWSFTFDRVGTWGVHDHEHPSTMMTITVTK